MQFLNVVPLSLEARSVPLLPARVLLQTLRERVEDVQGILQS